MNNFLLFFDLHIIITLNNLLLKFFISLLLLSHLFDIIDFLSNFLHYTESGLCLNLI